MLRFPGVENVTVLSKDQTLSVSLAKACGSSTLKERFDLGDNVAGRTVWLKKMQQHRFSSCGVDSDTAE